MKKFIINFSDNENYDCHEQRVWYDNEDQDVYLSVYDLCECPEDAMIGRDLFDGKDFINAIKLGFNIAKSGYDEIVVDEVPWEDE